MTSKKYEICRRVAKNIKKCRQAKNWSQEDLAKRLKVSQRYVAMLEQNARNLSLASLMRIAESLHVDIEDLVCRKSASLKLAINILSSNLDEENDLDNEKPD